MIPLIEPTLNTDITSLKRVERLMQPYLNYERKLPRWSYQISHLSISKWGV